MESFTNFVHPLTGDAVDHLTKSTDPLDTHTEEIYWIEIPCDNSPSRGERGQLDIIVEQLRSSMDNNIKKEILEDLPLKLNELRLFASPDLPRPYITLFDLEHRKVGMGLLDTGAHTSILISAKFLSKLQARGCIGYIRNYTKDQQRAISTFSSGPQQPYISGEAGIGVVVESRSFSEDDIPVKTSIILNGLVVENSNGSDLLFGVDFLAKHHLMGISTILDSKETRGLVFGSPDPLMLNEPTPWDVIDLALEGTPSPGLTIVPEFAQHIKEQLAPTRKRSSHKAFSFELKPISDPRSSLHIVRDGDDLASQPWPRVEPIATTANSSTPPEESNGDTLTWEVLEATAPELFDDPQQEHHRVGTLVTAHEITLQPIEITVLPTLMNTLAPLATPEQAISHFIQVSTTGHRKTCNEQGLTCVRARPG